MSFRLLSFAATGNALQRNTLGMIKLGGEGGVISDQDVFFPVLTPVTAVTGICSCLNQNITDFEFDGAERQDFPFLHHRESLGKNPWIKSP